MVPFLIPSLSKSKSISNSCSLLVSVFTMAVCFFCSAFFSLCVCRRSLGGEDEDLRVGEGGWVVRLIRGERGSTYVKG